MFSTHNQPSRLLSRCPQIMGAVLLRPLGPWIVWRGHLEKAMGMQANLEGKKVLGHHNSNGQRLVRVDPGWVLPSHINIHTSRVKGRCCHHLFYCNSGFKPVSYKLRSHGPIPSAQAWAHCLFYVHSQKGTSPWMVRFGTLVTTSAWLFQDSSVSPLS